MTGHGRHRLVGDSADFLTAEAGARPRPRALVFIGEPGIGASTAVDLVHAELLSRGMTDAIVVDDVDELAPDAVIRIVDRLREDQECRVIIAGRSLPEDLRRLLDRVFERRIVELPRLDDADCRRLLADLGVQPWSMHAAVAMRGARGNPRKLVDIAFADVDPTSAFPARDATFDPSGTEDAGLCAFYRQLLSGDDPAVCSAGPGADDGSAGWGAAVTEASRLLWAGDHEQALQLAERVVVGSADVSGAGMDRVRAVAAAIASAVRGFRGEPVGILSLHALAGSARRDGDVLVELLIWRKAYYCSFVRGDLVIARRAVERGIELADEHGSAAFAGWFRGILADWHLVMNEPTAAEAYLDEVLRLARARDIRFLISFCGPPLARALLARGAVDEARVVAEEAHASILEGMPQGQRIDLQVTVARVRAAAGDVAGALEVLGTPEECRSGADEDGQHFWLALEAVRIAAPVASNVSADVLAEWADVLDAWNVDIYGGALAAARLEVDAWRELRAGSIAGAARLGARAGAAWTESGCGEEVEFADRLVALRSSDHGRRGAGLLHALPVAAPDPESVRFAHTAGVDRDGDGAAAFDADPAAFELLTRREREIARYVAGGMTNPEIAADLHLSTRTVEHHVASILRKLELPNRRALVLGQV